MMYIITFVWLKIENLTLLKMCNLRNYIIETSILKFTNFDVLVNERR